MLYLKEEMIDRATFQKRLNQPLEELVVTIILATAGSPLTVTYILERPGSRFLCVFLSLSFCAWFLSVDVAKDVSQLEWGRGN